MNSLRVLEIIGGLICAVFALMGLNGLLRMNLNSSVIQTMHIVATNLFLVCFGGAASVLCFTTSAAVAASFGFLVTWSGRAVYFLLMGAYLYPVVCPRQHYAGDCFQEKDLLVVMGVIATVASVLLGTVIAVFRCLYISETCSTDVVGQQKTMNLLDAAAVVASAGVLLLATVGFQGLSLNGSVRDACQGLSLSLILFIFGGASLLASFRRSPFIASFFGFLDRGCQRGVFYLLMGCYTFAMFYNKRRETWQMICLICSCVSLAVGLLLIIGGR